MFGIIVDNGVFPVATRLVCLQRITVLMAVTIMSL
jgi:hypothetical protein